MTGFRGFVEEGYGILCEDYPTILKQMTLAGRKMVARIRYSEESLLIRFERHGLEFQDDSPSAVDLECIISPKIFFSIVDGRITLADAIWSRDLTLVGEHQRLLAFYRIGELLLGAVRGSPGFASLLAKFKTSNGA